MHQFLKAHINLKCRIHLKRVKPFNCTVCTPNTRGDISEKMSSNSTIIDCFFQLLDAHIQIDLV